MWTARRDSLSSRVAGVGVLLALAVGLGVAEAAFVPPLPGTGVRLGLANVAVLVALVYMGSRAALLVSIGRVIVVSLALGTLFGPVWAMSLAGAAAAWAVMTLLSRPGTPLSLYGVSVGGAVSHVLAQLGVASLVIGSVAPLSMATLSIAVAIVTGLLVGACGVQCVRRLACADSPLSASAVGVGQHGATTGR